MCVCSGRRGSCEGFPVELIIPILTYETEGVGRKQRWGWRLWDAAAVNSRLINYTFACGNILPKWQSGPCEATHLTARGRHTQKPTLQNTHANS